MLPARILTRASVYNGIAVQQGPYADRCLDPTLAGMNGGGLSLAVPAAFVSHSNMFPPFPHPINHLQAIRPKTPKPLSYK